MASLSARSSTEITPPFYFDEKWKLSKKEGSSRSRSSSSISTSTSTSTSTSPFVKNSSQKRCAFARKCSRLFKQQRARFYIIRRCIIMLICWRDS